MHLELRKVSLALLMSMLCLVSFAQRTIQGTIKDNTGEPLIGVSIVSGNNGGTVTDLNGDFTLNNVSDGAILKISYVGYKKQSIKVGNQTKFNIVMQSDDKTLDELVVVGYGVNIGCGKCALHRISFDIIGFYLGRLCLPKSHLFRSGFVEMCG